MPKNKTVEFTQTRMNTFLTCERMEWFQFQAGGSGIDLAVTEDYFLEGELGHYALHHWYKNAERGGLMLRKNLSKRIDKVIADMGPIDLKVDADLKRKMAAILGACFGYKQHYYHDIDHPSATAGGKGTKGRFEVLFTEKSFEVEIAGTTWRGKIDLGLKDRKDDTVGYFEHKFVQAFSLDDFTTLPLNLQALIYVMGWKALMGKYPDWYRWNVVKKSQLKRKGMKPKKGETIARPEPLLEFEARVQAQYVEEHEKMFFRPPPKIVEAKALDEVEKSLEYHINRWLCLNQEGGIPPMRWCSCQGKYNKACRYANACTAQMLGHKDGWNAPECVGLYRLKEVVHPELKKGADD